MIDLWTIALWAVIDTVIDLIVFWLFRVRDVTIAFNVLLNVIVPIISHMIWIQSGPSLSEQAQAIVPQIINLLEWFISALIGLATSYLIASIIGIFRRESAY